MSAFSPLIYPPHYPPTDRWKRFFIGVRWLGPDLSFFEDLCAIQADRTSELMRVWGDGARQDIATVIGTAFARHLRWPTPYFLPSDRLVVVAGGPKFAMIDDFGAHDAVAEIEERLGVKMGNSFWESAASCAVGELVDQLLAASA